MDLSPVQAARCEELAATAVAAAENAQDLLADAELLAGAGRNARAYALAAHSVESVGKALVLGTLAAIPGPLRARAPLRRMLEWHAFKLLGGLLLSFLSYGSAASRLAAMPEDEQTRMLRDLATLTDVTDAHKRRGLYVDLDPGGRIRRPSEITRADAAEQLAHARQAVTSVGAVALTPRWQALLTEP